MPPPVGILWVKSDESFSVFSLSVRSAGSSGSGLYSARSKQSARAAFLSLENVPRVSPLPAQRGREEERPWERGCTDLLQIRESDWLSLSRPFTDGICCKFCRYDFSTSICRLMKQINSETKSRFICEIHLCDVV